MRHAVLFFHGFNADAATHQPEYERLARAGLEPHGIDAVGHGTRRWPDLDERVAAPREEAKRTMFEIADATAAEVPSIVDALLRDGVDRVSILGVSMGGYIVYRVLLLEPRIDSAVSLLGSPEGLDFARFAGKRLLSITGEKDENVPPDGARALHEFLGNRETNYIELANAPHLLGEQDWNRAIDLAIDWITRSRDA